MTAGAHLCVPFLGINSSGGVATVGSFANGVTLDAIDFRPATGQLYGYRDFNDSYFTVNLSTGAATNVGGTPALRRTRRVPVDSQR